MKQKFHRIWFGDKKIPHAYEAFWQAWQRQHPSCEFITWTDKDLEKLTISHEKLKSFSSPVSRADLARYEILYQHGGIYIDCDMMPYNHMDLMWTAVQTQCFTRASLCDFQSLFFVLPAG